MIALDTNVIVRFLVRDDEKQAQIVYARFKQAETAPVLQRFFSDGKKGAIDLSALLIAVAAQARGCSGGITFDRKAAKHPFFRLLAGAV